SGSILLAKSGSKLMAIDSKVCPYCDNNKEADQEPHFQRATIALFAIMAFAVVFAVVGGLVGLIFGWDAGLDAGTIAGTIVGLIVMGLMKLAFVLEKKDGG
ncbi:MAG: hypothetical protein VW877_17025, partial [Pseudomonadaceae bacterium]